MGFTYVASQAGTNALHRARFLLGDTVESDLGGSRIYLIEDEEITSTLTGRPFNAGLADLADALATKLSLEAEEYSDESGVKTVMRERVRRLEKLAATRRAMGSIDDSSGSSGASAGSISGRTEDPA